MHQKPASLKGYTLIEIMVAISIMGVIFSFGFLTFRDFSRRQSIASAARKLRGDVSVAREKAISGEKPTSGICANSTLIGYTISFSSTTNYGIQVVCEAGSEAISEIDLTGDLTLVIPATNPILFKVLSKGTNLSQETQIRINQVGTSYSQTVYVSPSGDVK